QIAGHGVFFRNQTQFELHLDVSVIGRQLLDLPASYEVNAGIADMANRDFLIAEYASRESRRHPALLGFEAKVIDVQIGFLENLVQDLVGFLSSRSGLKYADCNVDRHSAGDFAGTQTSDAIGDCRHRTKSEPVVLTIELPDPNGILIVMTDRPCRRT